jgi:predicted site-specific integrase-resolvase
MRRALRTEEQVVALIRSGTGYLSSGEVARLFRVDPKTPRTWAASGRVECETTRGGHRRYPAAQFWEVLDGSEQIY